MDVEDFQSPLDVGPRDHHLTIEAPGTQQRRVKNVRTVGGGNQDDPFVGLEAVHLHQQLVQGLLPLVVAAAETGAAMTAHGVYFVDEDDARGVFLPLDEQIPHPAGADADKHLNEIGAGDGEEGHPGLTGNGPGQQGFTGAGRADQQYALGNPAAETGEFFRILQKGDDLFELILGFVDTGDVLEHHLSLIVGEQLGLALAETHRLAASRLHLPHEKNPDADQQQDRSPGDQQREPEAAVLVGTCLDNDSALPQLADQIRIVGGIGFEQDIVVVLAFDVGALHGDFPHLALSHRLQKSCVGDGFLLPILLGHHVEQQYHDQ